MLKLPPHYSLIQTDDGSQTLFSEEFNEACHSTAGARAETRFHYLEGCGLLDLLTTHDEINILEVGFGTGIGWMETQQLFKAYPHKTLNFISLELDVNLLAWSVPEIKSIDESTYQLKAENCQLTILIGDARKTIHSNSLPKIHAIYQDAFSPKRNPTLWTHQWFSDLRQLSTPDCKLSTYSASVSIRKSLLKAGWQVFEGPAFAQKRSSTRANLLGVMSEEFLAKLNTHSIPALDDKDFL